MAWVSLGLLMPSAEKEAYKLIDSYAKARNLGEIQLVEVAGYGKEPPPPPWEKRPPPRPRPTPAKKGTQPPPTPPAKLRTSPPNRVAPRSPPKPRPPPKAPLPSPRHKAPPPRLPSPPPPTPLPFNLSTKAVVVKLQLAGVVPDTKDEAADLLDSVQVAVHRQLGPGITFRVLGYGRQGMRAQAVDDVLIIDVVVNVEEERDIKAVATLQSSSADLQDDLQSQGPHGSWNTIL